MALLICSLVAIAAIGFTLAVREKDIPPAPVENPQLRHLENRRQVLYENLKDLQFEYHQGKLSDEDYQSLKAGFLYDLAGVMDAIEKLQPAKGASRGPDGKAAAETAAKKKSRNASTAGANENACPSCGAANPPGNRFCGQCGKPIGQ